MVKLCVKMMIALATALLMSPILATLSTATSTLDQSTAGDPEDGGMWYGITDGTQYYRQSFTAGRSGTLDKITMYLSKFRSPTSVTVDVQAADSLGDPTGPILASRILPGSALSDDGSDVEVIFADPPSVTAGSRYVVTLSSCVGCGAGGDLSWFASTANPYAGGSAYDWYSGPMPGDDFGLATYVGPTSASPSDPTVSFNYNGATGGTSVTSATVPEGWQGDADTDFPLPTKSGEVFTGWFNTQSLLNGQRITTINNNAAGELIAGFIPPELAQALNLDLPPVPPS